MRNILLEPQQLIAMMDYPPLHSPEALRSYYEKHKAGKEVEPIIVVPAEVALRYFSERKDRCGAFQGVLETFLSSHPEARFFMLGGKHRSAVATVLGAKIPCLIVENDSDVAEVHTQMAEGRLTGTPSVGDNFNDTLHELEDHYVEQKRFWTMNEKTEAMIKNKDIPDSMLRTRLK